MVGSRVRTSRVRRLVTLLAMAAIASALGGVAPAAAGGKPMPAAVRSAAAADRPPYLADPADPAVTTLASDLGISLREAQRRLGWQEPAIELAGELERALGGRYGDLWFDPHTGRVKVGIVGGDTALAARLIARRKLTAVTDVVPVRHSYAELTRATAWLTAQADRANPPAGGGQIKGLRVWRLPNRNTVELDLPRGQRLTTAQQATVAAARRRLGGKLTFATWAGRTRDLACAWSGGEFDCDPPLRGGVMLYIRNASGGFDFQCTAGFNARSTLDGKWYVMTAGHCGGPGRTFYVYQPRDAHFHVLGHVHNRVWAGDDDFGIITVDNVPGWNPRPWVYVHSSADTTDNPAYSITGPAGSAQGMRVCVSGAISGSDCGNVETLGGGGLARVDLCATHGDSGAPIFSGGKARGLLVGAEGADPGQPPTPPCQDRLYQGLTEASQQLHVSVAHT
jgi:streptogrisin B